MDDKMLLPVSNVDYLKVYTRNSRELETLITGFVNPPGKPKLLIKEVWVVRPASMLMSDKIDLVFLCQTRPTTIGIASVISSPERIVEVRNARGTVYDTGSGRLTVRHQEASCTSTTTVTIQGTPQIAGLTLFFGAFTNHSSWYNGMTHCSAFFNDEFVVRSGNAIIPGRTTASTGRTGDYVWFARVVLEKEPRIEMLV
jgi:hypothetical protein